MIQFTKTQNESISWIANDKSLTTWPADLQYIQLILCRRCWDISMYSDNQIWDPYIYIYIYDIYIPKFCYLFVNSNGNVEVDAFIVVLNINLFFYSLSTSDFLVRNKNISCAHYKNHRCHGITSKFIKYAWSFNKNTENIQRHIPSFLII